ncbi:hypothetical protein CYLTODRAFT_486664 [Cylindrobasidium torrendii FP15055 ss-10]|uniref:RRN6 K-rich C-terminal domain-containing protein n=1 Tax=Cylindrobasidium torrendii FP15055 ss-10 TaxID=1314674 RepID=A0A0D7BR32_9AGAR|nr:hypothetical protein CYLTODRAFT_486664 [Cylindrobasidium torrendii FP15055 ss-10]
MAQFWPTSRAPGQGKAEKWDNKIGFGFPLLSHGLVEAASLEERQGQFEWTLLKDHGIHTFRMNSYNKVFHSTHQPTVRPQLTHIAHQAEQGANFLRKHFPDVDVTSELMREEIERDAAILTELNNFDPLKGNLIGCVDNHYLAFPMGETGSDLNLSSLENGVFRANATPAISFQTPITHVVPSCSSMLAVRTYGNTSILRVRPSDEFHNEVDSIASITPHTMGGRPLADIKIPSSSITYAVNDAGLVYLYDIESSQASVVYEALASTGSNSFWRLANASTETSCLLASSKILKSLDYRASHQSSTILKIPEDNGFITSIEPQDGSLVRLCTTEHLLWLDTRFPMQPLLGAAHNRRGDRTLVSQTIQLTYDTLTFLTSLKNGFVNVYDISRASENDKLHANHDTSSLTSPSNVVGAVRGKTFVTHADLREDMLGILQLNEDGAVYHAKYTLESAQSQSDGIAMDMTPGADWDDAVGELYESKRQGVKTLAEREFVEEDISMLYNLICENIQARDTPRIPATLAEVAKAASVKSTCGDAPEHILTMYDALHRAHPTTKSPSRSSWLTQSVMNSMRGAEALRQQHITTRDLSTGARHWDLVDILARFDPSITRDGDAIGIAEGYEFDDSQTKEWNQRARQLLFADIIMASSISSPHHSASPRPANLNLETMTEALSIAPDPPEVEFSHLRPDANFRMPSWKCVSEQREHEEDEEDETVVNTDSITRDDDLEGKGASKLKLRRGIRLLLDEWTVGTSPEDYTFLNPYQDAPSSSPTTTLHHGKSKNSNTAQSRSLPSKRPPAIVPLVQRAPPALRSTQPFSSQQSEPSSTRANDFRGGSQVSALATSTQIMPGPYGGRPSAVKKKPARKRLGGF